MANPSYPKDMREFAKANGKSLVTVAVPGFVFQGPVDAEQSRDLLKWVTENILKKRGGKANQ
jgi:hypothetical protein